MLANERGLTPAEPTPQSDVGTSGGFFAYDGGFEREGDLLGGGGFIRESSGSRGGAGGFQRGNGGNACSMCPSLTIDPEFWETFKVRTCRVCKRSAEMELIPKGKAKQIYLLTDKDIANAGLGSLTRENPQQKTWSQMKLYLKKQVGLLPLG